MARLASVFYDPAVAVSKATTALLAMTALDTTNLRLTFTAPANGKVLVRIRGGTHGAFPRILLGVLDGATIRLRMSPMGALTSLASSTIQTQEAVGVVAGLTPGNSYTWDAAYGVEITAASSGLKYGGPNDATANNAFGGFLFEVWETANLLGSCLYDFTTAQTTITSGAPLALTAVDTTNLRITFIAPASGKVLWRGQMHWSGSSAVPQFLMGILEGSTIRARVSPIYGMPNDSTASTSVLAFEGSSVISGLTPGNSYTYDLAYGIEVLSSATIKFGGLNNTITNDAVGATAFEIWAA